MSDGSRKKMGLKLYRRCIVIVAVVFTCVCVMEFYVLFIREEKRQINSDGSSPHSYKDRRLPLPEIKRPQSRDCGDCSDDVTVVTAYFNLGTFQKGEARNNIFRPNLYLKWMKVFSRIENPVIAYFDTQSDLDYFKKQREDLANDLTSAILVNKGSLWSFSLYRNLTALYADPKYPKYHPNTVLPQYTSAMHAKYELMQQSLLNNPFKTKYFCWLDIGLYRDIASKPGPPFRIKLPPKFNKNKVAYTEVFKFKPNKLSIEQIILTNSVWLCGCFFIAERGVMIKWTQEYMKYADYFLRKGYSNTDQQIIYAIFKTQNPSTQIQAYPVKGTQYNPWFYLGYICKE